MHTAFIDTAVVTAIQDDYRAKARNHASTGSQTGVSIFARMGWARRNGNRDARMATTRTVAEALGRSVQGTRKSLHRIRMTLMACIERTLTVGGRA